MRSLLLMAKPRIWRAAQSAQRAHETCSGIAQSAQKREGEWYIRRELARELSELGQLLAQIYLVGVEEDGKDGLRGAGVVDHLIGKEDVGFESILGRSVIGFVGPPLEEEDQAVDRPRYVYQVVGNGLR
jgi:hypothetical protein